MNFLIKTFGCRVNQVESQSVREALEKQGALPASDIEDADIIILNTCTVTENADKDVERAIRQCLRRGPAARLILTGCYAAVNNADIKQKFPTVEIIHKDEIGSRLFDEAAFYYPVSRHSGRSRAFVKIQDGCDAFCSYCIVPFARNKKTSKPYAFVLREVQNIINNGFKEIVLTGINIGNYMCPETGASLAYLLEDIFKLDGEFRIRFSSIELHTLTDGLIEAAAKGGEKFCNYFHLPLQSGDNGVLTDMRRTYTAEEYADKVKKIRSVLDNAGIFADIIAGYPTESKEAFINSSNFIRDIELAGLHVFSYSARPGTAAAALPQLSVLEIRRRADRLREIDVGLRDDFNKKQIGREMKVLAEKYYADRDVTATTASNFVDVLVKGQLESGQMYNVKVTGLNGSCCTGDIV
ncbi:threonylcarbamoyladenosine tRNA methylthiotransferase MtaB [Parelusimicrobium proximum]|uniref:tRNA (N(6)-L-threonylcarbamoyladenosine(37)-C(2))- methylthiotransferase MtaB n=1 Tax=Parelusimicrobium proximum TaxID=3228953 RepID=UPI003D16360C